MRLTVLPGLLAGLVLAAPATAAPLEVYGRLPMIEAAELSPDGGRIAVVVTDGEQRNVFVRTTTDRNPTFYISAGSTKLRALQWAGPNHLLISASQTSTIQDVFAPRAEYFVTMDVNLTTRRQQGLFRGLDSQTLNITELGPYVGHRDGHSVVSVGGTVFVGGEGRLSMFLTDPDTNHTAVEATGSRDTRDWTVDETGRAVAALEVTRRLDAWAVRVRGRTGDWRTGQPPEEVDRPPVLLGLGRNGDTVVVRSEEGDHNVLREIVLETGVWSAPLPDSEGARAVFDPVSQRLVAFDRLVGDTRSRTYFDVQRQRLWNGLVNAFPGQRVQNVSFSDDQHRAIALVDSPTEGPAYALVDFQTGRATWIGSVYRGLTPADISPVTYITYRAADGLEIGAYLTLPRGRPAHGLPLVVLPHGGPEARDDGGFDWWAQALASRGYAVLQPNFRGSAGYGAAFVHAGYGEWGHKMQTDLSDGVRYLASQGTIDPARVCIVGASYGGYAALAGVTLQHGVYRCAAAVGGVSDPGALIAYSETQNGRSAERYWTEFMGVTGAQDPSLAVISPLAQAAHADAPILLVHGRDDTVVPFSQSSSMAAALQRANRPVQLVDLQVEDHWLSRGQTRLRMLTEVVRFLEANNPPEHAAP